MRKCFLCDAVGIKTTANSPQPIIINDKSFMACIDCYNNHHRAIQRGLRTMFERLFPADFRKIKARADARPRAVKQDGHITPITDNSHISTDAVSSDQTTHKVDDLSTGTMTVGSIPKPKLTIFSAD